MAHELDLEGLAHVSESLLRLLARPHFLGERFVARDDLAHFFLDDRQVFGRERLVAEEIVVEAILDHRTDRDLGARPQACTASASTWAASCRISSSARGSSREMNSILASWSIGSVKSASRHQSPSRRFAWPMRGKCPWRCPDRLCLRVFTACAVGKGQRDTLRIARLLAHSLPTNAGKRGTRYSRRIRRRN